VQREVPEEESSDEEEEEEVAMEGAPLLL